MGASPFREIGRSRTDSQLVKNPYNSQNPKGEETSASSDEARHYRSATPYRNSSSRFRTSSRGTFRQDYNFHNLDCEFSGGTIGGTSNVSSSHQDCSLLPPYHARHQGVRQIACYRVFF